MTIEQLTKFENIHPQLFELVAPSNGLHLWPLCRFLVHQEAVNITCGLSNAHIASTKIDVVKLLKYFWYSFKYRPKQGKIKEVVFFSTNVVNMIEDGYYRNRLYDVVYELFPDSITIIESAFKLEYRRPRKTPVYYSDWLSMKVRILTKLKLIKVDCSDISAVNELLELLRNEYPVTQTDDFYERLKQVVLSLIRQYSIVKKVYQQFCLDNNVKAVFLEDGSYGGIAALIIKALTEIHVVTAEFQHGFVGKSHPAYNYPSSVIKKDNGYHEYMPMHFCMFGEFWTRQVSLPSKIHIVGFGYLTSKAKKTINTDRNNAILIVSDGNLPDFNIKVTKFLCERFRGNKTVILKLHPGEVPAKDERYSSLYHLPGFVLKTYEPVYDLLPIVDSVVGSASTVMVEALAFKHIPYVYKSELSDGIFDDIPFQYWETVDELINLMDEDNKAEISTNSYFLDDYESGIRITMNTIAHLV